MVRGVAVCVTSLCGALAACGSPAPTDFDEPASSNPGISPGGAVNGAGGAGGSSSGAGGSLGGGGSASSTGGAASGGSGSGGTAGTAGGGAGGIGNAGSSGAPALPDELIDDMEDGDGQLLPASNRDGYWYTFGDDTGGYLTPAEGADFVMGYTDPARPMSVRAARLLGGNFQDWGAALAFDFKAGFAPYDASAYTGLRFYARSAQGTLELAVAIPDRHSTPQAGICGQGGQGPTIPCFEHPLTNVTLTQEWAEYEIPFSSLERGLAPLPPFDPKAVYSVHFGTPSGVTFDVWVDDVAFTR